MRSARQLTDEQRAAALAPDGPLLILAGPGTGKTAVVVARVVYLIQERRAPPSRLLVLTFAARAADELRERICRLLGPAGQTVGVRTFHGWGLHIVRRWSALLGYGPSPPLVYSPARARALLYDVAQDLQVDLERCPLASLERLVERVRLERAAGAPPPDSLGELIGRYEARLQQRGAIDYPAMLTLPLRLFRAHPEVLASCQEAYTHVLCDEFQDVNAAQYALLHALTQRQRQLVVVGDPLQRLYGWRGADGRCLAQFVQDFPEARVLPLRQNFRSTGRIVAVANALSAPATAQYLWTANPFGAPVQMYVVLHPQAEAAFVAATVQRLAATHAIDHLSEVAVLARTNAQLAVFAETFCRFHLPAGRGAGTQDAICLSTVHQAKGREWAVVFVVGLEEGLLPHASALGPPEDAAALFEERCVAYVAVTRAQNRLYLTCCHQRAAGGGVELRRPSRFLRTLPRAAVDLVA
jgi:DNA helicase II / ATP-dependent DNA helicase PcrA